MIQTGGFWTCMKKLLERKGAGSEYVHVSICVCTSPPPLWEGGGEFSSPPTLFTNNLTFFDPRDVHPFFVAKQYTACFSIQEVVFFGSVRKKGFVEKMAQAKSEDIISSSQSTGKHTKQPHIFFLPFYVAVVPCYAPILKCLRIHPFVLYVPLSCSSETTVCIPGFPNGQFCPRDSVFLPHKHTLCRYRTWMGGSCHRLILTKWGGGANYIDVVWFLHFAFIRSAHRQYKPPSILFNPPPNKGPTDRNFDPPGVANYSDPTSFAEWRKGLKKGATHYLDVHFCSAGGDLVFGLWPSQDFGPLLGGKWGFTLSPPPIRTHRQSLRLGLANRTIWRPMVCPSRLPFWGPSLAPSASSMVRFPAALT